jgi:hypothetical protein
MFVHTVTLAALATVVVSSTVLAENYGLQTRSIIVVGGKGANPASRVALNPQPLPPRESRFPHAQVWSGGAGSRMLNPQPLPPRESQFSGPQVWSGGAGSRMLNPQPLPPRYSFGR